MKFQKRQNRLIVTFTKEEAMKELRRDRRILKVIPKVLSHNYKDKTGFTIYTRNIVPTSYDYCMKSLVGPIGKFMICVFDANGCCDRNGNDMFGLSCIIQRVGGYVRLPEDMTISHPHVPSPGNLGGVCWGGFEEKINELSENMDWYFYSLQALNLLECFDDESEDYEKIELLGYLYFMRKAAERGIKKKKALYNKARRAVKNNDLLNEGYNDGWWTYKKWLGKIKCNS